MGNRLKIGVAGVISKKTVEYPLGGTERFNYLLVDGLVKKGHKVRLYCAKGSETPAEQVEICSIEKSTVVASNVEAIYPYTLLEIRQILEDIKKGEIDILHVSFLKTFLVSFFAEEIKIPIIHTVHRDFFSLPSIYEIYKDIGIKKNEHFVFVSKNALSNSLLKANTSFIYNGINVNDFPYTNGNNSNQFVWLSRIDNLKGPKEAALAAKNANIELLLSGDIDREKYQKFFHEEINPLLTSKIIYKKAEPYPKTLNLNQNSKAFLFPIQWEEPFGYVMVESMACGTPIIAFARGSVPELVKDGETGFIINSSPEDIRGNWIIKKTGIEGLVEAIKRINSLSKEDYLKMRIACRKNVEINFSIQNTVDNYEKLYQKLLNK